MALLAGDDLTVVTDNISCRVAEDTAQLRCRSCGEEDAVLTVPRPTFLAAVRRFIHEHRTCLPT